VTVRHRNSNFGSRSGHLMMHIVADKGTENELPMQYSEFEFGSDFARDANNYLDYNISSWSPPSRDSGMVLVTARTGLFVCIASLSSSLGACSSSVPPPPTDAAPPLVAASSCAKAPALVVDAGPGALSADAASEASVEAAAPEYSREGIQPLDPTCKDPRAVLGKAAFDDPSLIARIRQAVAAHPEMKVTAGSPGDPRKLTVWRAEYGTKNFSISTPGKNTYAVIARCADATSCLDIAAMVRAVVPGSKPVLVCGEPPRVSGGTAALSGPWGMPDTRPLPSDRTAVCARVTACSVRLASQARDVATRECSKAPLPDAARCAAMDRCSAVVGCWRGLASQ